MTDTHPRHQLFEAARKRAGWTVQQLWVGYLAVGGSRDAFDIEAYLYGLGPPERRPARYLGHRRERAARRYLPRRVRPLHRHPDP
jgi:hypothetical protein